MARVTTMAEMWWPLMDAPSVEQPWCAVCGRAGHVEMHHMVPRSGGRLFRDGAEVRKPVIALCGHGNVDGCHGKAHSHRLHFGYWDGALWCLETDEPTPYLDALGMGGWREVRW